MIEPKVTRLSKLQAFISGNPAYVVRYSYICVIHTEEKDIRLVGVRSIDTRRDYVTSVGDDIKVVVSIPAVTYMMDIIHQKGNLELTLFRAHSSEPGKIPQQTRYKARLFTSDNVDTRGSLINHLTVHEVSKHPPIEAVFQCIDLAVESVGMEEVSGVYSNVTHRELLHNIVGGVVTKAKKAGSSLVDLVDIVEPHNSAKNTQVVIPSGVRLLDLPTFLQKSVGGLYSGGVGTYIQPSGDKKALFIYPIYVGAEYDKRPPTMVLVNSRVTDSLVGTANTHTVIGEIIYISVVCDNIARVLHEQSPNGVRQMNPDMASHLAVVPTARGPVGEPDKILSDYVGFNNQDQGDFSTFNKKRVTANPYARATEILSSHGETFTMKWLNSVPELIRPGATVEYQYLIGEIHMKVKGVILMSYTVAAPDSGGIEGQTFLSTTLITFFVPKK
jgi:hypothetical protein